MRTKLNWRLESNNTLLDETSTFCCTTGSGARRTYKFHSTLKPITPRRSLQEDDLRLLSKSSFEAFFLCSAKAAVGGRLTNPVLPGIQSISTTEGGARAASGWSYYGASRQSLLGRFASW